MNKINLEKNDTYEVLLRAYLSDFDRKVLVNLYQPLCGAKAIALFFSLWSELEFDKTISKIEKNHEGLLKNLDFNTQEFVQCRKQLEALGLLRTLYHDGHYLYLLYAPKDPKHFFDYEPFDCLLKNKVGEMEYEKARAYFGLDHIDGAKFMDISQDFNDVYVLNTSNYKHQSSDDLIGHDSYSAPVKFDFKSFYASLKDYFIKADVVTKEVEDEIALLATSYRLSVSDMVRLVYKSLDSEGKINIFSLRKYARLEASNGYHEEEKVLPENTESGNEEVDQLLAIYNNYAPVEFLTYKNFGNAPLERDIRLVKELESTTGLTSPVLNALLDYCLRNNDNRLNRSYIQTIAGSLFRSKITDAYEAMVYLNERKTRKSKKVTPIKEVEKEEVISDDEISEEEMQKSLAVLKELKKGRK